MKLPEAPRSVAAAVAAATLLLACSGTPPAPPPPPPAASAPAPAPGAGPVPATAPSPSQEEAMAKWQAAMTPGEPHRFLAGMEGNWTAEMKMWMDPAAPPEASTGTSVNRMVLGGRFLEQRIEATSMGQPFSGIGYTGYDNTLGKYVGVWMDSMGTGVMSSESTSVAGGEMECRARYLDPVTGGMLEFRERLRIVDSDHHTFEMWARTSDGAEYKNLEIAYTRKK